MNIHSIKHFKKNPSFISRKIADEYILVPINQKADEVSSIYTFNDTAARIWDLLDTAATLSEIRDLLVQEFEVDKSDAESDIVEFIEVLKNLGAVEVA